jgi:hypothetical protein
MPSFSKVRQYVPFVLARGAFATLRAAGSVLEIIISGGTVGLAGAGYFVIFGYSLKL